jgi:predicted dehydrogenase
MEAFMVRFHPQWLRTRELVQSGALGDLRAVQVWFSYFNRNASNIRNDATKGGGALMDIGCYPIVAGRFLFGAEPVRVMALADVDPDFGVDRTFSALLDFGNGRRLDFTVSMQAAPYQRVQVIGTEKRVELEIPFNAPPNQETRIFVDDGKAVGGGSAVSHIIPASDQYSLQGDAFSLAIRGEAPLPYGVDDAIQNMRIIDTLFASHRSGQWESL